jgi:prepilin-type N-terminal cleavage/methylation domain-containing protein
LRGFSLVELMVATAVGAILLLGLTDVMIDSKTAYEREEQFARLQESGRVAALAVARQLRRNRSMACRSLGAHAALGTLSVKACALLDLEAGEPCDTDAVLRPGGHLLAPERALGYDAADAGSTWWLEDLPAAGRANVAERWLRGDVLVIWGVADDGVGLRQPVGAGREGPLQLDALHPRMSQRAPVLITDCQHADVFEITGPDDARQSSARPYLTHGRAAPRLGAGNASEYLARAYDWRPSRSAAGRRIAAPGVPARVHALDYDVYFVCCADLDTGRLQSGADVRRCEAGGRNADTDRFRPSLCGWNLRTARSQPLVTDIADLRITYSGDRDGDGRLDFFAHDQSLNPTAGWVHRQRAWAAVQSADVEVLAASPRATGVLEPAPAARQHWPPNGAGSGGLHPDTLGAGLAPERRLHKRFRMTVVMRARTPWSARP